MIRRLVIGAVAMLIALAVTAVLFLDAAAARIVASAATRVLGAETTVASSHLGLFEGRSTLHGLDIRQPSGFPEGSMISVREASVTAGLSGLLGDSIEIEEITISGVVVHIDEASGKVNLEVVANHVSKGDTKPQPTPAGPSRSVVVHRLTIHDITVIVSGRAAEIAGKTVTVTIPDIIVTELGTRSTVSDIAERISRQLLDRLTVAIVEARIEGLASGVGSTLQVTATTLQNAGAGILTGAGDGLNGALEKAGQGIGDAMKGILGK